MLVTPFDAVVGYVRNITWAEIVGWIFGLVGLVIPMAIKAGKAISDIVQMQKNVTKMATNDLPHMFHTLLNMDKNIAKMTGGDAVDFTELDAMKKDK